MSINKFLQQSNRGQSVIEVIVAVGIFVIIAGSAAISVISSLRSTRLAKEESQATMYAMEGLEAAQSIRNQNWENLADGSYGLSESGGEWEFSGSEDQPDDNQKYTRQITISPAQRNDNGDLVASGGTTDADTKLVVVSVAWDFVPTRNNEVVLSKYFTNWQQERNVPGAAAPEYGTCAEYCALVDFNGGACRSNANQCDNNNESHKPIGDTFCSSVSSDTCCCQP